MVGVVVPWLVRLNQEPDPVGVARRLRLNARDQRQRLIKLCIEIRSECV